MNKFEKAVEDIKEKLGCVKEINEIYLYGSVARGDYSLKYSDIDLFIVLGFDKKNKKAEEKINKIIREIQIENYVKIHAEFQYQKIREEDYTLIQKVVEEGVLLYSKTDLSKTIKIGLDVYYLYEYSTAGLDSSKKSLFSKILHGKKVGKYEYKGIVDNNFIISVGRGCLIVHKSRIKDIETLFDRYNVAYKRKRRIFI